jgi:peptidyl-prolyl cis-trans isomerase C
MPHRITLLAAALAAVAFPCLSAQLAGDTPLVTNGALVVDANDFEGNMLRIPEDKRAELRMSYDRVATIVDNIFVARTLAERAKELGLDKDPAVQRRLQQVQDGVLADLYMRKREKEAVQVDLEARARDLYKANQASLKTPELVYVQHILVNLQGRTKETALETAKKIVQEARAGEDFLALAARYSDENEKKRNGGDLGYNSPSSFTEPVRKAIAAMNRKDQVSDPIETEAGFHIVKFIDRKQSQPIKFEDVRKRIVDSERERIQKSRVEDLVREVRENPKVVIHRTNVEALVVPLDEAKMKKAQEDAQKDPPRK